MTAGAMRGAEDCPTCRRSSLFFSRDPSRCQKSVGGGPSWSSCFIALKAVHRRRAPPKTPGAQRSLKRPDARTLALRGRAAPADSILKFIVDLPDGVAWNVLSYWPPRRVDVTTSHASTYSVGERPTTRPDAQMVSGSGGDGRDENGLLPRQPHGTLSTGVQVRRL